MISVRFAMASVLALALAGLVGTTTAKAADCRGMTAGNSSYSVCEVTVGEDLRLFLNDSSGEPLGSFERLRRAVEAEGKRLVFAMNAGMYHADRRPVGLYVENRQQLARIVTSAGPGNFGLLPNGVFCIAGNRFSVIESRAFRAAPPDCIHASQSGPMLVIDGQLHPRFLRDSDSLYVRNGVGVSRDGKTAWFVISNGPVNFHEFGSFFRDTLKVPAALYFDGSISKLYAPQLGRADLGRSMGPMLALIAPKS